MTKPIATRKLSTRASISLQMMAEAPEDTDATAIVRPLARRSEPLSVGPDREEPQAAVIVESSANTDISALLADAGATEVEDLGGGFVAAIVPIASAHLLYESSGVRFVEAQKQKRTMLDKALVEGAVGLPAARRVTEQGEGVVVGVIDSGFDLSHPAFRDAAGNLRVDALLEHSFDPVTGRFGSREFTTAQLEAGWRDGTRPGFDQDGHGTHVADIAAGSPFNGASGVAPKARFVLVKTDFIRLTNATKWCFERANGRPCVVNMSLGGHHGAHDGMSAEERALDALSGPGKIVVLAAGNERADNIHIGARFARGQSRTAAFDISTDERAVTIVAWFQRTERFEAVLISPSGAEMAVPATNAERTFSANGARIRLGRIAQARHDATQLLIDVQFLRGADLSEAKGWSLRITCLTAVTGRFDAWITGNSRFRNSPLVETARTIGLPATANSVIAVASHVTKNRWLADDGPQTAPGAVVGRSSPFSSVGPTRDGRQKPEISAPGQMITAALAAGSDSAGLGDMAHTPTRALTIAGTSMATPFVSGVIALMLQVSPRLAPADVLRALQATAVKDAATGRAGWTPQFGHGKISAKALIDRLNQAPSPGVAVRPSAVTAASGRKRKAAAARKAGGKRKVGGRKSGRGKSGGRRVAAGKSGRRAATGRAARKAG